jgi:hypothetical protein
MAIRLPLTTVLDYNSDSPGHGGPTSVAGGVAKTFQLPQDIDNVVVKLTASIVGGGVSAALQTTDDGGTTWYDIARSSIVSNATNADAEWISAPVNGVGIRSSGNVVASAGSHNQPVSILATIGKATAAGLGQKEVSGLPILSQYGRIWLTYTAAVSSIQNERVRVLTNSQSATA